MVIRRIGNLNINYTPSAAQTDMYNTLGRYAGTTASSGGGDNFFTKRAKSLENAFGTTGAAIASDLKSGGVLFRGAENIATENLLKDNKARLNDVAKKYGYDDYHDIWDARDAAEASGDMETVNKIDNVINPELRAQADVNAGEATAKANRFKDYLDNNYVSQKVNQDRGKFAGSAINTLSTGFDVLSMAAGIPNGALINAGQGAIEGVADELEQNGFQNFDWGRAGQNAATGAASGAVTGALNTKIGNRLGVNGGNIINGNNFITKGANSLLKSGVGRGALSGAVGGATGAGLSSAMNGVELGQGIQNTLSGAAQGAVQGGIVGGTMSAANRVGNATLNRFAPDVAQGLQENAARNASYGDTMREQFKGAWNSGDSPVANRINDIKAGSDNGFGLRYNQFAGDADGAINYLLNRKGGEVEDAVRSPAVEAITGDGRIDLVYGKTGDDGYGLAHIVEKHGENIAKKIPSILETGRVIQDPNYTNANRVTLVSDDNTGAVRLGWDGNKKQWVVTAYEGLPYSPASSATSDIATGTVLRGSSVQEPNDATVNRIIPQSEQNVNTKAYWEQEMKALDAEGVPFTSPRYQAAMDEWKKAPETVSTNFQSDTIPQDIQNMGPKTYWESDKTALPYGNKETNDAINKFLNTLTPEDQIPTEGYAYGKNASARREAIAALRNEMTDSELAALMMSERNPKVKALLADAGGQNVNEYDIKFRDERGNVARLPELRSLLNPDNRTVIANSDLIDSPIRGRMYNNMSDADFIDYAKKNGWNLESITGGTKTDYGPNAPETEVYRTLAGETEPANTDLMYGESTLGNRTRRGMLADSLERFGNTLEGAQTNVTRAAAKDLGIESTGKVVENVRKKTGIVNLETQAALAKELTGGENSLMDSVQRIALSASENGQPYKVDTDSVLNDVESIVDKYADTNMFGSQKAKDRFISNLRRDISNYDSDILSIANRMKSNAADLRGKGVASPTPADAAKAKIYTEIANRLDDLSYKAIPQDNVEAMFDATIAEMRGRANQAANNGNTDIAKAYNKLADSLDAEPRTVQAFRSFKKDFVDASKINELTARAENGAAVQMGRSLGGSLRRFGGTLLQRPINTALAKAGGAVNSLADRVGTETSADTASRATTTVLPQNQVYNAIGRTEGEIEGERAAGNYIDAAAQETGPVTLDNMASNAMPTTSTSVYNSLYGGTSGANGTSTYTTGAMTSGDYYTSLLERAMQMAMDDGNADAFVALYNMYNENAQNTATDTAKQTKLTDKQRQANAAERALNDFEGAEHNLAYDLSDIPLVGGIANLGGNEYASKAEALALQIGYMLSGATVNKEEAKNIGMAYVPQPRDNEAVRKAKLQQLRGIIADYQQTYEE